MYAGIRNRLVAARCSRAAQLMVVDFCFLARNNNNNHYNTLLLHRDRIHIILCTYICIVYVEWRTEAHTPARKPTDDN